MSRSGSFSYFLCTNKIALPRQLSSSLRNRSHLDWTIRARAPPDVCGGLFLARWNTALAWLLVGIVGTRPDDAGTHVETIRRREISGKEPPGLFGISKQGQVSLSAFRLVGAISPTIESSPRPAADVGVRGDHGFWKKSGPKLEAAGRPPRSMLSNPRRRNWRHKRTQNPP